MKQNSPWRRIGRKIPHHIEIWKNWHKKQPYWKSKKKNRSV